MTTPVRALLGKEWVKLRKGLLLLPVLLGYATVGSLLVLRAIERRHGAFGLWATLLEKEPHFFQGYLVLAACGVLVGFLQAWPEFQGRRLRLLFHLPVEPRLALGVMIATGMAVLLAVNLVAYGCLGWTLSAFHLPWDIVRPVLLSVAPWSLLGVAAYLLTIAFFACRDLGGRAMVVAATYAAWNLLAARAGYGLYGPSLWGYALGVLLLIPFAYQAFLRFVGEVEHARRFPWLRGLGLLAGTLTLSLILPDLFSRILLPQRVGQRIFFSPVHDCFAVATTNRTTTTGPTTQEITKYALEYGKSLDRRQYAEALPFLYAEDLLKWNRFPETIAGVAVEPHAAKFGWQYQNFAPRDWNAPAPMLHMLLEAEPRGARLEMPEDVFRVRHDGQGLEFLRPETGQANKAKSALFTDALKNAGFVFPVVALGGNPDARKEYDFGYLLVDAAQGLFRLQQVTGKPRVVRSAQSVPGHVRGVLVSEHRRREYAGVVVTDQAFLVVMQQSLELQRLPLDTFQADHTQVTLWSDPLGRSVVARDVAEASPSKALALGTDFALRRAYTHPADPVEQLSLARRARAASTLFPLRVVQGTPSSPFLTLNLEKAEHPKWAWGVSVALALLSLLWAPWRGQSTRAIDALLIAIFGMPALLALWLTEGRSPGWLRRG